MHSRALLAAILLLCALASYAQILTNPNLSNKKGKRIGTWTVFLDKDLQEITSKGRAVYYRVITYDNEEGNKLIERTYKKGELIDEVFYKRDGSRALLWDQMDSIADVLGAEGRIKERIAMLEDARYQAALEFGKEDLNYILACGALAKEHNDQDNFNDAEPLYLEARQFFIDVIGTRYPWYGTICFELANIYSSLGDLDKTESFRIESAETFLQLGDTISYAQVRMALGITYKWMGKMEEAEKLMLEARETTRRLSPNSFEYAQTCESLATLNIEWVNKMYGFREARDYYDEALAVYEVTVGTDHPAYARCLAGYSRFIAASNPAEAERMLLEARDIRASAGRDSYEYNLTNVSLAHFYRKQDEDEKAKPYYEEMKDYQLRQIRKNFVGLSEKEQQTYFQSLKFFFDDYVSFYINNWKDTTAAANIFNLQLLLKGFLYQSTQKTKLRIMGSGDSVLIKLYEDLRTKREDLSAIYQLQDSDARKHPKNIAALEDQANRLEKDINRRASQYGIKDFDETQVFTWRDVRAKLKKGEAVVEIIRTSGEFSWDNEPLPGYLALIVTPETKIRPQGILWSNGYELETRHIKFYRNSIQNQLEDLQSYDEFWGETLPASLKGTTKIFFSPDGVYHQLNLSTLKNPKTGKYLGDEITIQVIGTTRDLVQPLKVSQATRNVLFGFPDYTDDGSTETLIASSGNKTLATELTDGNTSRSFTSNGSVVVLPGTRDEVNTIQKLLADHNKPVDLFMGKVANEKNLKDVKDPKILHVATHGFFLADAVIELDKDKNHGVMTNPLLRSGLLMAGCEKSLHGKAANGEDGILTAYEAMNLFLDETDLVVLSACETGLGEILIGEGVYGLQRSFQQAGARSVLISLWKVSDVATQLLMTSFYDAYLKTNDLHGSFASAQKEVRLQYPEPYYWGAFVLVGK